MVNVYPNFLLSEPVRIAVVLPSTQVCQLIRKLINRNPRQCSLIAITIKGQKQKPFGWFPLHFDESYVLESYDSPNLLDSLLDYCQTLNINLLFVGTMPLASPWMYVLNKGESRRLNHYSRITR